MTFGHRSGRSANVLLGILLLTATFATVAAQPADASSYVGVNFIYDKNACVAVYSCAPDPKLTFNYMYLPTETMYSTTWTASSGNSNGSNRTGDQSDPVFGKKGKDPCYRNVGWIPDSSGVNPKFGRTFSNSYRVRNFPHYSGSSIFGWVYFIYQGSFSWSDGAECGDNDNHYDRTELFIHSEMTSSHGQSYSHEKYNWVTYSPNYDYASNGCIKINYYWMVEEGGSTDSGSVEWRWNNRHDGSDIPLGVVDGW